MNNATFYEKDQEESYSYFYSQYYSDNIETQPNQKSNPNKLTKSESNVVKVDIQSPTTPDERESIDRDEVDEVIDQQLQQLHYAVKKSRKKVAQKYKNRELTKSLRIKMCCETYFSRTFCSNLKNNYNRKRSLNETIVMIICAVLFFAALILTIVMWQSSTTNVKKVATAKITEVFVIPIFVAFFLNMILLTSGSPILTHRRLAMIITISLIIMLQSFAYTFYYIVLGRMHIWLTGVE